MPDVSSDFLVGRGIELVDGVDGTLPMFRLRVWVFVVVCVIQASRWAWSDQAYHDFSNHKSYPIPRAADTRLHS